MFDSQFPFYRGILYQNHQEFKEAIESFQKAIQYRPSLACKCAVTVTVTICIFFSLLLVNHINSRYEFISQNSTVAYLNMGTSLIALGRCNEAAKILRDGSKLDGNGLRDRSAHDNARMSMLIQLGSLYAEQGKLQRALAVYREALHNLPKNYPPQVEES